MIMSNKIKNIIGTAFLFLFIFYTCSISLFPHKHIINGIVYVHSHPYEKDSKGNPIHSHTSEQIHTIQILSHFSIISFTHYVSFKKVGTFVVRLFIRILNSPNYTLVISSLILRAPPKDDF
jgi:hypothetical protein